MKAFFYKYRRSSSIVFILLGVWIMLTIECMAQTNEILIQDDFNRECAPALGAPWTEENEFTEEFELQGYYFGPGFIELNQGTLAFHYQTHSQRSEYFYESINARPYAFAPLKQAVTSFPAKLSISFTPNEDARICHFVGLMSSEDGFFPNGGPGFEYVPWSGFGVLIDRSSWRYNNSHIVIAYYKEGIRTDLAKKFTTFQFEPGVEYTLTFSISQDFSTTVEVSDGVNVETISYGPTYITFPMNRFVIADVQGGISFDTPGEVDLLLLFDDLIVEQTIQVVEIDIKPGSYLNSINLGSGGNVRVAIFSSATFDATSIDSLTITLAGSSVILKGKGTALSSFDDINGDGILDLIVHVETTTLQLTETDMEAVLRGRTFEGSKIIGHDYVRIVP